MYTANITYYSCQMTVCCPGQIGTRTTDNHLTRIISTSRCIHTVVPPDNRPRYARNMQRLTKYTKNKQCIKLVFLYTLVKTVRIHTQCSNIPRNETVTAFNIYALIISITQRYSDEIFLYGIIINPQATNVIYIYIWSTHS